jgi:hypothetical protein
VSVGSIRARSDVTGGQQLTCRMSSVVPNTHIVSLGTRARVGVACKPSLLYTEACLGPFILENGSKGRNDLGGEADTEGCALRFAYTAAGRSTTADNFLCKEQIVSSVVDDQCRFILQPNLSHDKS